MGARIRPWWTRWAWGVATLCVLLPRADAVGQVGLSAQHPPGEHDRKPNGANVGERYRQRGPWEVWG